MKHRRNVDSWIELEFVIFLCFVKCNYTPFCFVRFQFRQMRCGVDPMNVLDSNCVLHTHTHTQQRCFIRLCVSPRNAEDAGISRSTGIDGKKRWNKCRLRLQIVRRMNASALIFADWTGHDARQRVCRRKDALSFGISDTFFGNSILIYFIRSQVRRQRHTSHGDERKEKLFFFFFSFSLLSLTLSLAGSSVGLLIFQLLLCILHVVSI